MQKHDDVPRHTDFTQKPENFPVDRENVWRVAARSAGVMCGYGQPTGHLDSAMADWLENYLKMARCAGDDHARDHYFLDSVCNRLLSRWTRAKVCGYETNYSGYLGRKAEREESAGQ